MMAFRVDEMATLGKEPCDNSIFGLKGSTELPLMISRPKCGWKLADDSFLGPGCLSLATTSKHAGKSDLESIVGNRMSGRDGGHR